MNIVGIDPGPEKNGLVRFECESRGFKLRDILVRTVGDFTLDELKRFCGSIANHEGIKETVFYCESFVLHSTFKQIVPTIINIGRILEIIESRGGTIQLVERPVIKKWLGCQTDSMVRQYLISRFGGTKKGEPLHGLHTHHWPALAAAVAGYEMDQIEKRRSK
jgi:hypothetical protein